MMLSDCFPIWDKLDTATQNALVASAQSRHVSAGAIVHNGTERCTGLILVQRGLLRVFSLSDDGREVTLYRLLERDICLFSASCMIQGLQLDLSIQAEQDTDFWLISPEVYKNLMEQSPALSAFTTRLMAGRFSDVMWLVNQILWKRMDQRVAAFLLEEAALQGADTMRLTHETIANHLGTAREVITRTLKYLRDEGCVELARGTVRITDAAALERLQK